MPGLLSMTRPRWTRWPDMATIGLALAFQAEITTEDLYCKLHAPPPELGASLASCVRLAGYWVLAIPIGWLVLCIACMLFMAWREGNARS